MQDPTKRVQVMVTCVCSSMSLEVRAFGVDFVASLKVAPVYTAPLLLVISIQRLDMQRCDWIGVMLRLRNGGRGGVVVVDWVVQVMLGRNGPVTVLELSV